MSRAERCRPGRPCDEGITLLEILIAISLLGICFSALFAGFSTALGTADRIKESNKVVAFATEKLNEITLDPALRAGMHWFGASESGLRWQAKTELADQRPGTSSDHPVQLVRVSVEVEWDSANGPQHFALETLKLCLPETGENP